MERLLFKPVQLGQISLPNRIVMAPMTRARADNVDMPSKLMKRYYSQRASSGLIITEGVHPDINGQGYACAPGLYNDAQQKAWQGIQQAVAACDGQMVMQLMHCGRVGHPLNKRPDAQTFAPSAIAANVEVYTSEGKKALPTPKVMSIQDVQSTIANYAQSARRAMEAGFAGVELHCASGYLPMQFLSTGTNHRKDAYGGSLHNRLRFTLELIDALNEVCGGGCVGVRVCPANPYNDMLDQDPTQTYKALFQELSGKRLAYLHVIRSPNAAMDAFALAASYYDGDVILNDSFSQAGAESALRQKNVAAVSFARHFIANPDLVERFYHHWPRAGFKPEYLYKGGEKGYCDYPAFCE